MKTGDKVVRLVGCVEFEAGELLTVNYVSGEWLNFDNCSNSFHADCFITEREHVKRAIETLDKYGIGKSVCDEVYLGVGVEMLTTEQLLDKLFPNKEKTDLEQVISDLQEQLNVATKKLREL